MGYTTRYAIYVHEAPMKLKGIPRSAGGGRDKKTGRFKKGAKKGKYWDPQGIATNKFLEGPFRENRDAILTKVANATKASKEVSLTTAITIAGLFLMRKSQQVVPVDTGNLKASAFTRLE